MEIRRGRFILRSDRWCFWIDEEYQYTDKKTGKTKTMTRNASGYYADFSQLANGFANHLVGESDAKSMKKLLEDIRSQKEKFAEFTYKKLAEQEV